MIRQYKWVLFISTCLPLWAATQQPAPPQQFYTSAGAYRQSPLDLFSAIEQTAALAGIETPGLGITGVRPYLLPGLNQFRLYAAVPAAAGCFAFKAATKGGAGYTESQSGLAYSRQLGERLSAGLCFTYNTIKIDGYGRTSVPSAEAGLLLHITRNFHTGWQLKNPVSAKRGINKQAQIPLVYVIGFGYEPSAAFYGGAEIIKEEEKQAEVALSLQYKPADRFWVKAGLYTTTSHAWAGAGFQFSRCRFDLFVSFHPQLGFTPGTSIIFQFKKQADEKSL